MLTFEKPEKRDVQRRDLVDEALGMMKRFHIEKAPKKSPIKTEPREKPPIQRQPLCASMRASRNPKPR